MKSQLEELLAAQLDEAGITHNREQALLPGRRWRADFAILDPLGTDAYPCWLIVEVNGQGPQGRHGGYGHAESDAEKLSACACLGYRVLVVTGKQVRDGRALEWIRCALGIQGDPEAVFAKRAAKRATGRHKRSLPARVRRAAGLA